MPLMKTRRVRLLRCSAISGCCNAKPARRFPWSITRARTSPPIAAAGCGCGSSDLYAWVDSFLYLRRHQGQLMMYTAVSGRTVEIATLRVLGFESAPIAVSVFAEALLLALAGGVLGACLAWLIF